MSFSVSYLGIVGGSKFLEGQTITLEDGTTAVIQAVTGMLILHLVYRHFDDGYEGNSKNNCKPLLMSHFQ